MSGDRDQGFTQLFAESRDALRRYVSRLVRSQSAADEIVQEAFLQTYVHREKPEVPRAFLFSAAKLIASKVRRHACQLVQALQTIVSRNASPVEAGVISATMIHAGEAINVIPDCCEIRGTVRTFSSALLDLIERRMRRISEAVCAAFDARCEFAFDRKYPPLVNHVAETEFVRTVLMDMAGADQVREFAPTMLAEDFSFYLQDQPGCYFAIGNGDGSHRDAGHGDGPCRLHNPSYDFNDSLIPRGASMWVRLVEGWFGRIAADLRGRLTPGDV